MLNVVNYFRGQIGQVGWGNSGRVGRSGGGSQAPPADQEPNHERQHRLRLTETAQAPPGKIELMTRLLAGGRRGGAFPGPLQRAAPLILTTIPSSAEGQGSIHWNEAGVICQLIS